MYNTEWSAYYWLIDELDYQVKDIFYQCNKSPDFICVDGRSYEVKRVICKIKKSIYFTGVQMDKLQNLENCEILVMKKSLDTPISIIPSQELEFGKKIDGIFIR